MPSRRALLASAAGALLVTGVRGAHAQNYPARPISFIVPFAPGGTSDIVARALGQKLSERAGWSMVIENKPGAASSIGANQVAKAAPDGHTILLAAAPFVITQYGTPKPPYDARKDFVPVTLLVTNPLVVAVGANVAANTLPEFLAYAKANAGRINYGSPGVMSLPHLATELLAKQAGLNVVHVPYRGGGPVVTDLLGGRLELFLGSPVEVLQHVRPGGLKILAVTSRTRLPSLPDVPTADESGLPGYEAQAWFGVLAAAGTPADVVARLNAEMGAALRSPDLAERLREQGAEPATGSPEAFGAFLEDEHRRWSEIAKTVAKE